MSPVANNANPQADYLVPADGSSNSAPDVEAINDLAANILPGVSNPPGSPRVSRNGSVSSTVCLDSSVVKGLNQQRVDDVKVTCFRFALNALKATAVLVGIAAVAAVAFFAFPALAALAGLTFITGIVLATPVIAIVAKVVLGIVLIAAIALICRARVRCVEAELRERDRSRVSTILGSNNSGSSEYSCRNSLFREWHHNDEERRLSGASDE